MSCPLSLSLWRCKHFLWETRTPLMSNYLLFYCFSLTHVSLLIGLLKLYVDVGVAILDLEVSQTSSIESTGEVMQLLWACLDPALRGIGPAQFTVLSLCIKLVGVYAILQASKAKLKERMVRQELGLRTHVIGITNNCDRLSKKSHKSSPMEPTS